MRLVSVLLVMMIGCKPTEKSVVGVYRRYLDFENDARLTINKDKTFKLDVQEGIMFFGTNGTWALEDNKLIVNSYDNTNIKDNSTILENR